MRLLLLFGSAAYFVHDLTWGDGLSVLGGSWLGCLMLALSAWWFYRLNSRAPAGRLHAFEQSMRPWLVACGCLFTALMPFLLYPMDWASTLLAILGALAVIAARPMAERGMIGWGCAYQVLAGGLYLSTLQPAEDGTVLASGWNGLAAAGLIGVALLAAAWAVLRQGSEGDGKTGTLGGLAGLVLLGGLAFINLAPLFVLPWHFAAMVWPATGIATLWWAIRNRQKAALAFALGLQLIAGAVSLGSHLSLLGWRARL